MALDGVQPSPVDGLRRVVGEVYGPVESGISDVVAPVVAVPGWLRGQHELNADLDRATRLVRRGAWSSAPSVVPPLWGSTADSLCTGPAAIAVRTVAVATPRDWRVRPGSHIRLQPETTPYLRMSSQGRP